MSESAPRPLRIGILGAARITERALVAPARSGGAPEGAGVGPRPRRPAGGAAGRRVGGGAGLVGAGGAL
ncbi:hypothetical protein ACFV2W_04810, partial [Streptomyces cellulosae]